MKSRSVEVPPSAFFSTTSLLPQKLFPYPSPMPPERGFRWVLQGCWRPWLHTFSFGDPILNILDGRVSWYKFRGSKSCSNYIAFKVNDTCLQTWLKASFEKSASNVRRQLFGGTFKQCSEFIIGGQDTVFISVAYEHSLHFIQACSTIKKYSIWRRKNALHDLFFWGAANCCSVSSPSPWCCSKTFGWLTNTNPTQSLHWGPSSWWAAPVLQLKHWSSAQISSPLPAVQPLCWRHEVTKKTEQQSHPSTDSHLDIRFKMVDHLAMVTLIYSWKCPWTSTLQRSDHQFCISSYQTAESMGLLCLDFIVEVRSQKQYLISIYIYTYQYTQHGDKWYNMD